MMLLCDFCGYEADQAITLNGVTACADCDPGVRALTSIMRRRNEPAVAFLLARVVRVRRILELASRLNERRRLGLYSARGRQQERAAIMGKCVESLERSISAYVWDGDL